MGREGFNFLRRDGSKSLTGNMSVDSGITIDGVDISDHAADLDAHTFNLWQTVRTGEWQLFQPQFASTPTETLTVDNLYARLLIIPRAVTVDRIAIEVTTLDAGTSIRLGIYNDGTNLYPGTLKSDCGVVSSASTGLKTVTISVSLPKGIYWLVCVSDGAPVIRSLQTYGTIIGQLSTAMFTSHQYWKVAFSYAALPDPFTAGGSLVDDDQPLIGVRVASLD